MDVRTPQVIYGLELFCYFMHGREAALEVQDNLLVRRRNFI
jgi:hypothetical protein